MPALHRRRGLWSRHQGDWSGSLYFKHQGTEPLLCLTSSYAKQWAGRFLSHSPVQNRVMSVGVWAKEPKWCPNSTTEKECSVAKSCSTLCDPMDCSTPGSSVLHYLSKFAQIHVHWGSDAVPQDQGSDLEESPYIKGKITETPSLDYVLSFLHSY